MSPFPTLRKRFPAEDMPCLVKSILSAFSMVLLGCMCSGCLFRLEHNTTSPGARGVVLDAQTRSPLSGADVVVSRLWMEVPIASDALTNTRPPVVTTGRSGLLDHLMPKHLQFLIRFRSKNVHSQALRGFSFLNFLWLQVSRTQDLLNFKSLGGGDVTGQPG